MLQFLMLFERRLALLLLVIGVVGVALSGCSSSSSGVGEVESTLDLEGQLQKAEREIADDPTDTDAYLLKARLLRQKADTSVGGDQYIELYRQAVEAEEQAISVDPEVREEVQSIRKKVYKREKNRGDAAYNEGVKKGKQASFKRAIGFFGAAGVTQSDSARPVLNEAYSRLRAEQGKEKVIPVLEEYVDRADTVEREAYKILGQFYVSNGAFRKAETLLDQGIKTYPNGQSLQALRLNAYNRAGDVDEALAAYREQLEQTPKNPQYLYNYGSLLLKANRYDHAIDQLEKAVKLQGDNAEGQYNLGAAYLNAALVRDDSIATLEQNPDAIQDTTLSVDERVEALASKRQELFKQAVAPLERARKIVEKDRRLDIEGHEQIRQDACRALLVAYVQTERENRAAKVEDCTGFARTVE